jgi:DNA-binding transcriptional MerR regulator
MYIEILRKEVKMVKEQYLINEAAKEIHVESHVLRYWEEELDLPIGRNEQGHRVYTKGDIEKFKRIKNLKDQGLQLKAVRSIMEPEKPTAREIRIVPMNNVAPINKDVKPEQKTEVEQSKRVWYLFQKLIKEAVSANNEEMVNTLTKNISDNVRRDLAKELDYQFRLCEERSDARIDERSEEHYRQIDSLLRKYSGKPSVKKTVKFPRNKEKKEIHLFKKTKKNATH